MKNKDIFRKLGYKLFFYLFIAVQKRNVAMGTRGGDTKRSHIFGHFHRKVLDIFLILFCIKLIKQFIHQCKIHHGKELYQIIKVLNIAACCRG